HREGLGAASAPAIDPVAAAALGHEAAGCPTGHRTDHRRDPMQVATRIEDQHVARPQAKPDAVDAVEIEVRGVVVAIGHTKRASAMLQIEDLELAAGLRTRESQHEGKQIGADLRRYQTVTLTEALLIIEMRRDEPAGFMGTDCREHVIQGWLRPRRRA